MKISANTEKFLLLNVRLVTFCLASAGIGYTIEHMDPKLFRALRTWWGQYILLFLICASLVGVNLYKHQYNILPILTSSAIAMLIIRWLEHYYGVEDKNVRPH